MAVTLMFGLWLVFGELGIPIRNKFGLTDVLLWWITAVALLNGLIRRMSAGTITDRLGQRKVFALMLTFSAIPAYLGPGPGSYTVLLFDAFLVGFADNACCVGIA